MYIIVKDEYHPEPDVLNLPSIPWSYLNYYHITKVVISSNRNLNFGPLDIT